MVKLVIFRPLNTVEKKWIERDQSTLAFVLSQDAIRNLGDQKYRVFAYVDAQNSFGAMIRQNYAVTVHFLDETNRYRISDVSLH